MFVVVGIGGVGVVEVNTDCNTQPSKSPRARTRTQVWFPTIAVSGSTWTTSPLLSVWSTFPVAGSERSNAPPPVGEVIMAYAGVGWSKEVGDGVALGLVVGRGVRVLKTTAEGEGSRIVGVGAI